MRATRFYTVESRCQIVTDLADPVKPNPKKVVEKTENHSTYTQEPYQAAQN